MAAAIERGLECVEWAWEIISTYAANYHALLTPREIAVLGEIANKLDDIQDRGWSMEWEGVEVPDEPDPDIDSVEGHLKVARRCFEAALPESYDLLDMLNSIRVPPEITEREKRAFKLIRCIAAKCTVGPLTKADAYFDQLGRFNSIRTSTEAFAATQARVGLDLQQLSRQQFVAKYGCYL